MAFKLPNGIVIDKVHSILLTKPVTEEIIACINNVSEFNIEVSSESTDNTNAEGALVYRKYAGKTAEVTGTVTMLDMALKAIQAGTDLEIATAENKLVFPDYKFAKAGSTLELPKGTKEGTVKVYISTKTYAIGAAVEAGESAATTDTYFLSGATLNLPTSEDVELYCVSYDREVEEGFKYVNKSDKVPKTMRMLVKAVAVDPCEDILRPYMIEVERFQMSPDTTEALSAPDATFEFNGSILANVCSDEKELYSAYFMTDEEE